MNMDVVFRYTFDYHDDDVYWCTADIGWITGHSYIVYGPMANGATGVMVTMFGNLMTKTDFFIRLSHMLMLFVIFIFCISLKVRPCTQMLADCGKFVKNTKLQSFILRQQLSEC